MLYDVEKVIRVLGYIVYTILWSPVIIVALIFGPIVWIAMFIRMGATVKEAVDALAQAMHNSIQHDINFIKTGNW